MASFCEELDMIRSTDFGSSVDSMLPANIFDDNYFLDPQTSDLFGGVDSHGLLLTASVAPPGGELLHLDSSQVLACDEEVHAVNKMNLQRNVSFQDVKHTSQSVFDDGITADDLGSLLSQFEQVSESRSQSPTEKETVPKPEVSEESFTVSLLSNLGMSVDMTPAVTIVNDANRSLIQHKETSINVINNPTDTSMENVQNVVINVVNDPNGSNQSNEMIGEDVNVTMDCVSSNDLSKQQSNTITTSRSDSALLDSAGIVVHDTATGRAGWDHDYCQAPPKHIQKMTPGVSAGSIHADDRSSPFRICKSREGAEFGNNNSSRNRYAGFKIRKGSPNVKIIREDSPCLELNSSDKAMLKSLLLNDDALKKYNEEAKSKHYKDANTNIVPMELDEDLDGSMSSLDVTEETISNSVSARNSPMLVEQKKSPIQGNIKSGPPQKPPPNPHIRSRPETPQNIRSRPGSPLKPPPNPHIRSRPGSPQKPPPNPHIRSRPGSPQKPSPNPHIRSRPGSPQKPPSNPHIRSRPGSPQKPPPNPHIRSRPGSPQKPPPNPHIRSRPGSPLKPPPNPHIRSRPGSPQKPPPNPHIRSRPGSPQRPPPNPHIRSRPGSPLKPPPNPHIRSRPGTPDVKIHNMALKQPTESQVITNQLKVNHASKISKEKQFQNKAYKSEGIHARHTRGASKSLPSSRESTPTKERLHQVANILKETDTNMNVNRNANDQTKVNVEQTGRSGDDQDNQEVNAYELNKERNGLNKSELDNRPNVKDSKCSRSSHIKHKAGNVDNNSYFDKLPPYVTALSKPPPPRQSASLPILANDTLPHRDPSPDKNENLFTKLPAYYSCFTNSTKYDSLNSTQNAQSLQCDNSSDSLNNNCDKRTNVQEAPIVMHSARSRNRRNYRTGASDRNRSSSSSSSSSRSRSRSKRRSASRSYSPSSSISSIELSPSRSRSRSYDSNYERPVFRISSSSRSRSRSSSRSSDGRRRSRYRSRSPLSSRSRSRSRSRSNRYRGRRRRDSRSPSLSPVHRRRSYNRYDLEERKAKLKKRREEEKSMQIEQRRIVYVGRISNSMTKQQLQKQFDMFGDIEEVSVHFRDNGDNYGFVTFMYTCDAYAAIEKGNTIRGNERYDLCFGGRRQFCKSDYADLDGNVEEEEEMAPVISHKKKEAFDFDELLRQATKKIKK